MYLANCLNVRKKIISSFLPPFSPPPPQVVELLLARGANKEHRNVSDYTPLSLAASGGYVNIIKILLNAGAEINSRQVLFSIYKTLKSVMLKWYL